MAFATIASKLTTLPKILVGPILRRVEKNNVTVFIVSKQNLKSVLKVFNINHGTNDAPKFISADTNSFQIGESLYVSYITASTSTPADFLTENQKYEYNIYFPDEGQGVSLQTSSMMGNLSDYLYSGFTLPNFVFVPDNIANLRISHGSCRKPHGEWSDNLLALDKMIEDTTNQNTRPHLLCLTGDQIYADDVSDTLLFLIRDAQKALVNFNEKIPAGNIKTKVDDIALIKRIVVKGFDDAKKIKDENAFDENFDFANQLMYDFLDSKIFKIDADEHESRKAVKLIDPKAPPSSLPANATLSDLKALYQDDPDKYIEKFKEFYYTGTDPYWPKIVEVVSGAESFRLDNLIPGTRGPVINASGLTVDSKFQLNHNNIGKSHLMGLGEFYLMYMFVWSDVLWCDNNTYPDFEDVYKLGTSSVIKKTRKFFLSAQRKSIASGNSPAVDDIDTSYKQAYDDEKQILLRFAYNLKKIRRLLAHVPSYMVFDDHEITDDWLLNVPWIEKTSDNSAATVANRIMTNGMTAFTVFQSWGNDPQYFSNLKPFENNTKNLLEFLQMKVGLMANQANFTSLQQNLLPSLTTLTQPSSTKEWKILQSSIQYSFTVNYENFTITGLDTRTKRGYVKEFILKIHQGVIYDVVNGKPGEDPNVTIDDDPPAMINDADLETIINSVPNNKALNIFLTPSPVIGHSGVEYVLEFLIMNIISEELSSGQKETLDYEAWHYNRHCFEYFLKLLTRFDKVVFLSGDVHYAFSYQGKYWDRRGLNTNDKTDRSNTSDSFSYAQLTSSSFKNQTSLTKKAQKLPHRKLDHFGWLAAGNHMRNLDVNTWLGSAAQALSEAWFGSSSLPAIGEPHLVPKFVTLKVGIDEQNNTYIPATFDAYSSFVEFARNPAKKFAEYFVKKVKKIKQTFNNAKDWIELTERHIDWYREHDDWLNDNSQFLIDNFSQLQQDWSTINANWPTVPNYWANQKLTWLQNNYDFLQIHFTKIKDYYDGVKEFLTTPAMVKFLFPINVYYKFNKESNVNHYPDWFYRHNMISDARSFGYRLGTNNITDLENNQPFDFSTTPATAKEKYQKLSVFGHLHWQFINRTVIGANNTALISFDWGQNDKKIIHTYWADIIEYTYTQIDGLKTVDNIGLNNQNMLKPYTIHEISMNTPVNADKPDIMK